MDIPFLLNPQQCDPQPGHCLSHVPPPVEASASSMYVSNPRRQKLPKDAAIFADVKVSGPVNFPPHESRDDEHLLRQHRKFQIYPLGRIMKQGARHIPYNSDKKDFFEKTGRTAFEVFQYEFKVPWDGNHRTYSVFWDYQVGLVKITPFFKSLGHGKTTPSKSLSANPGLRAISYSITGGALAAQGYWMPFKAAKALAATFCYDIRYALTPIFGTDFLAMCTHPKDPNFGKFLIDPAIVRDCTEETHRWRVEDTAYRPDCPMTKVISTVPGPNIIAGAPHLGFACPPWGFKSAEVMDQESGYGTDDNEKCLLSPEISPRSTGWTPINKPKLECRLPYSPSRRWLTSVPGSFTGADLHKKRDISKLTRSGDDEGITLSTTASTNMIAEEDLVFLEEYKDECYSTDDGVRHCEEEIYAAEVLMQLRDAGENVHRKKRIRRGSIF